MKIQQFITSKGLVTFISFFLLISCGGGEVESITPVSQDIIPKNLTISVDIIGTDTGLPNGNGSGTVVVVAYADNASSYLIKYGDSTEDTSEAGVFEHTYAAKGLNSFTIQVFATSTSGNTIGEFVKISVLNSQDGMTLIWSDEFNTDGAPNSSNWGYDLGANNGWGNGESQYYTNSSNNVIVTDGLLKITAKKENFQGSQYTSSRLLSKGKFDFTYGRVEVRAKLPTGRGTWPAIWMLGANFETVSWPACGEIDIMEHVGNQQDKIHATLHYPNNSGGNGRGGSTTIPNVSSMFHIYEVVWDASSLNFSVDGEVYYTFSNDSNIPFNHDFFLILNVAMGGNFGGAIATDFIQSTLEIDYIRVFQ
jgi:beta-glucanase (GH16 family)